MLNPKFVFLPILMILFVASSCQMKYNKKKWNEGSWEMEQFEFRDKMLDDLLETHQLKGKSLEELDKLFGDFRIDTFENDAKICFDIVTDYGWDIDPVYTKDLILSLGKDSLVCKVEVIEWKK